MGSLGLNARAAAASGRSILSTSILSTSILSTSMSSSAPSRSRLSTIFRSQERQRSAPTEGNLSAGRPARNNPIEPPTKLARGNKGTGGDASGNRLPPHVPTTSKARGAHLEAEEAAALAAGVASTDLQFATTLVRALEAGAAQRADEVAAAAAADFETAFSRRKAALASAAAGGNGSASTGGGGPHDAKHLAKTLRDHAETRRGQLRSLRHALRGDVQALVREGKASKDEAARADAAVEGAFKRASAALEEAAASALERAAKLAG